MDTANDETKIAQRELEVLDPQCTKKQKYLRMQEKLEILYFEYLDGRK